ncbi:precorrin-3B synthase [Silvimonas terrae]|uniref:Precorrin-3B synthase n=1 Tax=Silvimonas terrae TaxID=300266 RepID=A0A840RFE0_9NEIS|nr:precorrin-3B synthase [Silvimonas terrae]
MLHIVPALDAGLCRIRLPGGVLTAEQAHALAAAASRHASGIIEATNRANLQLRGVTAGHESALIEALLAAGLGPQAGAGSADARDNVRNVMQSPLAGRDEGTLIDTRPLTADLLTHLQSVPMFAALSPKFCILFDGGEALAATDHPHDIWLSALPADALGPRFALGLAGCPGIEGMLISVRPDQVIATVDALLHAFLRLAGPDQQRMRQLLTTHSAADILQQAQTQLGCEGKPDLSAWPRQPACGALQVGIHAQAQASGLYYVGARLPLGRMTAAQLHALADLSHGVVHFTPWQGVLLPDLSPLAAEIMATELRQLGLLTDWQSPLTRLIACAGSAGCVKSQADVKTDAVALAGLLTVPRTVHLSGCPRSCAAAHTAPWTLLAVSPGHYDLYQRSAEGRFGTRLAQQLNVEQAAGVLNRQPASPD